MARGRTIAWRLVEDGTTSVRTTMARRRRAKRDSLRAYMQSRTGARAAHTPRARRWAAEASGDRRLLARRVDPGDAEAREGMERRVEGVEEEEEENRALFRAAMDQQQPQGEQRESSGESAPDPYNLCEISNCCLEKVFFELLSTGMPLAAYRGWMSRLVDVSRSSSSWSA
jgi:hypothetical protein